jgi:hypothetical protein
MIRERNVRAYRSSSRYVFLIVGVFLALQAFGCATLSEKVKRRGEQPKYVVSLPEGVTFVVFPFNNYLPQKEFAANVEKALIKVGLNIISPPSGKKEVEERKGAALAQGGGMSDIESSTIQKAESQAIHIEKYTVAEDTKADYIINTMVDVSNGTGTVRFTRKSDMKVIGVATVYSYYPGIDHDILPDLEKMNFVVREKKSDNQQ